jgi:hypothetical protein
MYIGTSNLWPFPPKYLQINYRTFQIVIIDDILYTHTSLNFPFFLDFTNIVTKY